jgi:MoaA/NifB/PqqE/SkfB family radical SAM enzyme
VLDEVKPSEVYVSGGEPLVHSKITQFLEVLKARGVHTILASNANNLSKLRETIPYVDMLQVSLDGIEEDHDDLRGYGNFRLVISNLKDIRHEIGKRLRVSFTVWKEKMVAPDYMSEFLEIIRDEVFPHEVILNVLLPAGRGNNLEWQSLVAKELQIRQQGIEIGRKLGLTVVTHRGSRFNGQFSCPGGHNLVFYGLNGYSGCSWLYKHNTGFVSHNIEEVRKAFDKLRADRSKVGESGCPFLAFASTGDLLGRDPLWHPKE